jgi:hypothetical protein
MLAMKTIVQLSTNDVVADMQYLPVISLLIPFDPKMVLKTKLLEKLSNAASRVEGQLLEKYHGDTAMLMIEKLRTIIAGLNYNTHKKSVAIYLSPVLEKVIYMDIAVEEKIIVDGAFDIRDLVQHKKQEHSFLVMLVTNKESRIYLGKDDRLIRIVTTTPKPLFPYNKKEQTDGLDSLKQSALAHFLQHADNTLEIILKAYPLPLFICGDEELLEQFKAISKGGHAVVNYIYSDVADATVHEIQKKMAMYTADWASVQQQYLACRLQKAARDKRLVTGIKDVWQKAVHHKGSLLLVEKNYQYPEKQNTGDEILYNIMDPYHPFSYIKNIVGDIIEKVLENGGDIEYAENNLLAEYGHIVLMQPD